MQVAVYREQEGEYRHTDPMRGDSVHQ